MERKAGFTLIELLITLTIMVVLLTLSVISLRSSQATARDEERKADVAVIAQQLENYYRAGADSYPHSPGRYPPTTLIDTEAEVKVALRDIDPKVLRAPDVADTATMSFTVSATTAQPSPNINKYFYQPLEADGSLCNATTDECRKFNLYYTLESDSSTVQKIMSKNQ